ncbi:MAG: ComF family protein [Gammaproteobacteria bacterium]|nr:ComF family protein [Gammaproteobacteria bacterium]
MIKRILDIIYPRRCVLCLQTQPHQINSKLDLCVACQSDLLPLTSACYQCGIPLEDSKPGQLCGQCLQKRPAFDHVISIYHYQNPLIWLIQQMKFHNKPTIAYLLGQLMAKQLAFFLPLKNFSKPEVIIPVPLHYKRQYERGFNQAEEFAKIISTRLDCTIDTQFLERSLPSQQQSGLDAGQRRKNVKGIFRIKNKKQYSYKHIAIIDDVMSTGSTVNEIAKTLKKAGVEKVDVWVLARASKR